MTNNNVGKNFVKYTDKMDPECIPLCDAINSYPGFKTFESCCGHGFRPFWIFFEINSLLNPNLPLFFRAFDSIYNNCDSKWTIQLRVGNVFDNVFFLLEGSIGSFDDANKIAKWLVDHLPM